MPLQWLLVSCFVLLLNLSCSNTQEQPAAESNPNNRPWGQPLLEALKARDAFIDTIAAIQDGVTVKKVRDMLDSLAVIPSKITGLDLVDESFIESDLGIMKELLHHTTEAIGDKLFRSKNLVKDYNQEMGRILRDFQGYHNFRCLQALYSSPNSLQGFNYPIGNMCFQVNQKLKESEQPEFSTNNVCKTVIECSGKDERFPYDETSGSAEHTDVEKACHGDEKHCDVAKAVPMMGGLLWYKISKYMARSICRRNINFPEKDVLDQQLKDIEEMIKLLMAYASTLNWKLFFEEAMNRRAFSNLDVALGLISEYEKSFSSAPIACYDLKSAQSCIYGDINTEYQGVRKTQRQRLDPGNIRSLRCFERVNHAKMVELKKDTLDHIEILGNIRSVDENLGEATNKMKAYFKKLAEYDQGIADQDVGFIVGKLEEYKTKSETVSKKLQDDMRGVLIATNTILALQLVDEIDTMANLIAEHMNPLKNIFGGVEIGEILEQVSEIAVAAAKVARAAGIFDNLKKLFENSDELITKFAKNTNQITGMQTLIDSIKTNSIENIGYDADKFIKAYGDFTPRVDRSDLAQNDALWGAFQASACELLYTAEGAIAGAAQLPISGMLMCEKLEGTIAEYTTLRESIFDFQFELVDALARVVRGQTAKKMAEVIKQPNKPIPAADLMLGYFKIHNRLQSSASSYCNKLEYLNQGRKIPVCNPSGGLFSRKSLDDLIAYNPDTTYHLDERFVYIPTRPQFPGDQGFISLSTLKEGAPVTFRLPSNRAWLKKYNWVGDDDSIVPFLQSFKLYLPHKNYAQGGEKKFVKTRVRLSSIGSSAVGEGTVVYNLPAEHSQYLTAYTEGFNPSRCPSGKEIANPYSLCGNLPNVCDSITRVAGTSILPTILSTWKLSYVMETSEENFKWDSPDPATNLLLIAKVKLRFPSLQSSKRSRILIKDGPKLGCCSENMYRANWNDKTCTACPVKPAVGADSIGSLGGYYCEKGIVEGTEASKKK